MSNYIFRTESIFNFYIFNIFCSVSFEPSENGAFSYSECEYESVSS